MDTDDTSGLQLLVYSQGNSPCRAIIDSFLADHLFVKKVIFLNSLDKIENQLAKATVDVVCIDLYRISDTHRVKLISLFTGCLPYIPLIALTEKKVDYELTRKLLKEGFSDIVSCVNDEWLAYFLTKLYSGQTGSENLLPVFSHNSYNSFVNRFHFDMPIGLIRLRVDDVVTVEYINRIVESTTGFSLEDYNTNPNIRQTFFPISLIRRIVQSKSHKQHERVVTYTNKAGEKRWIKTVFTLTHATIGPYHYIMVFLFDVTEQQTEKILQKGVYDIARLTSTNFSLNRVFVVINKIISDLVNIDNFYIALYDEELDEVSFPYVNDIHGTEGYSVRRNGRGLTEYVIRLGKSLLCREHCVKQLAKLGEIEVIGQPAKVWMGIPLKHYGKVIGIMAVQHYSNDKALGEAEMKMLEYLSEQVARTIDYKKKVDEIRMLSTAVEQSPSSIVITNLKPEIIYVNKAFIRITGYSEEEVIGENPRILQSGETPKQTYTELWNKLTSGETWHGEFRNRRKNGEVFIEDCTIVPITDEFGRNVYYLAVKNDVTQNRKLFNELVEAKERAEESDRLKTSFLQNISHEIRTPMNAIVGFAELLEMDHDESEKILYYTGIIKQRSYDLLDIVNELLDIARIESGQLKPDIAPVNLHGLLNDLKITFTAYLKRMDKEGVEIRLVPPPETLPAMIKTDEAKFRQILANLIHNALKFTREGFVEYGFFEQRNGSLVFCVRDSGIGIPPDMQDRIFDRFQKANFQAGIIYDGLGLGLSIVKGLVDILKGEVWLESEVGKGTTFYVAIPYYPVKQEPAAKQTHQDATAELSDYKLLVVEDDTFNIAYFSELFTSMGVDFHIESSGSDAIAHFRENTDYDMVLMDIKLPDMTGYEVVSEFKKISPDIPIIAQTAYAAESDREKALEVGCVDYISKPIFRDKLIQLLDRHLGKS